MMPVVLQVRIHERDPELNPQVYYLYFKDEKSKVPLENYLPLRYKKTLSTHWSDDFYKDNCKKIKEDVADGFYYDDKGNLFKIEAGESTPIKLTS